MQIGKVVRQGCIWSPCLFNLYAELSFSCLIVSNSLWPLGLQHTRLPCPSPSPGVCSNSRPLGLWCHPIISSSVTPFFSCLQSFPSSGSFPTSQLFISGGQSIGASASASAPVFPGNIQGWFPLGLSGLISLLSQGTLKSLLQHHNSMYMQSSLSEMDASQARIKIAGRNINNLRFADDITLTAESEEELKNLLMRVKEESEKVGLN